MERPLSGVRVLDMSRILAGPYRGMTAARQARRHGRRDGAELPSGCGRAAGRWVRGARERQRAAGLLRRVQPHGQRPPEHRALPSVPRRRRVVHSGERRRRSVREAVSGGRAASPTVANSPRTRASPPGRSTPIGEALSNDIDRFYNTRRLHCFIGYTSPWSMIFRPPLCGQQRKQTVDYFRARSAAWCAVSVFAELVRPAQPVATRSSSSRSRRNTEARSIAEHRRPPRAARPRRQSPGQTQAAVAGGGYEVTRSLILADADHSFGVKRRHFPLSDYVASSSRTMAWRCGSSTNPRFIR